MHRPRRPVLALVGWYGPAQPAGLSRSGPKTSSPLSTVTAWPIRATRSFVTRTLTTPPRVETWCPVSSLRPSSRRPERAQAAMRRAADGVLVHTHPGSEEPRDEIELGRARTGLWRSLRERGTPAIERYIRLRGPARSARRRTRPGGRTGSARRDKRRIQGRGDPIELA